MKYFLLDDTECVGVAIAAVCVKDSCVSKMGAGRPRCFLGKG